MDVIYLDNNATTEPAPEVVEAMCLALTTHWHNPSSMHRPGQMARRQMELAREKVCKLIHCKDRELVFTSGGTEAANTAVIGSLQAQPGRSVVVTSRLEHPAVRESAEMLSRRDPVRPGAEVIWLPNDELGLIDLNALGDVLKTRGNDIAVVSIMWGNNETGIIQPVERIGAMCREAGVRYHVDGTQWVGKMPVNVEAMPIDILTFAAHKFHGPKGIGAMYLCRGVRCMSQVIGGPQERDRRSGTENTPGMIGMGVACELAAAWLATDGREKQAALRDAFEQQLVERIGEAGVNGADSPRVWNTSNIGFDRLEAEAILLLLSEKGVCASAGSACSSGSLEPSAVLKALNVPPHRAHGSVRFSLSRETTAAELDRAAEIIASVVTRLRANLSAV